MTSTQTRNFPSFSLSLLPGKINAYKTGEFIFHRLALYFRTLEIIWLQELFFITMKQKNATQSANLICNILLNFSFVWPSVKFCDIGNWALI